MSGSSTTGQLRIKIDTFQEHLDARDVSLAHVMDRIKFLVQIFGAKYARLFPVKIGTNDLDRILYVAGALEAVQGVAGFDRHIRQYSKLSMEDHLFTAKAAAWLTGIGKAVEFEPETASDQRNPDLRCTGAGHDPVFVECKRIRAEKFFGLGEKQELADLIYAGLPTCDQLEFFLLGEGAAVKLRQLSGDKNFASLIYRMAASHQECEVAVGSDLRVRVIGRPAIIGAEDDFPTVRLEGWLEDNGSGVRLPGFAFMRGGRCIGIHGPPPDYSKIWNRKRSRSKRQSIEGRALITFVSDDEVLGDPADHRRFFHDIWLSERNPELSGLALLGFAEEPGKGEKVRFEYFSNPHARHPVCGDYFDA